MGGVFTYYCQFLFEVNEQCIAMASGRLPTPSSPPPTSSVRILFSTQAQTPTMVPGGRGSGGGRSGSGGSGCIGSGCGEVK